MNPAKSILAKAVAKHGVTATLIAAGNTYSAEADTSGTLKVLFRKYEGAPDEKPTGLSSDREKFVISEEELQKTVFDTLKAFYRIEIDGFIYTIKKATPSYAYGERVRWDVEAAGQQ